MQSSGLCALSQFAQVLQQELFPALEPALGEITERQRLFIAASAMVPFSRYLPCGRWNGRPSKDRLAIARAFLAKSIYGLAHTRQLLEVLKTDTALRKLCGWSHAAQLPHESTFSHAFAEFAQSELPRLAHEAIIASLHSQRLIWHIARDSTAIEARERLGSQAVGKMEERKPPRPGKRKPGRRERSGSATAAKVPSPAGPKPRVWRCSPASSAR